MLFRSPVNAEGYNPIEKQAPGILERQSVDTPVSYTHLSPDTLAAALVAQKVQRFLLDNADITTVMEMCIRDSFNAVGKDPLPCPGEKDVHRLLVLNKRMEQFTGQLLCVCSGCLLYTSRCV